MSGTNASVVFDYDLFGRFVFEEMPKGECFGFSVNPYNGLVVMKYNRSPHALVVVDDVLSQVFDKVGYISSALDRDANLADFFDYCNGDLVLDSLEPCPFCGHEPELEFSEGFGDVSRYSIVCCDGRVRISGFDDRFQAVRFWNGRARKAA